jgi:pimeloyl-ACP methyl ester carboxylesterase
LRSRTVVAVAAISLLAAACTGSASESSPAAPTDTEATASPSAADLSPELEALPLCVEQTPPEGEWRCGPIEVPFDPQEPSATIALNVRVLPHSDGSVPPGAPIFTLSGGPGASGFTYGTFSLPPVVNAHHDVVWLDQRGTGTSDVIDCRDLQNGVDGAAAWRHAVASCGKQLGDASDRYAAGDAANDLEAIREALGYDTVILEGQSYGSITTQAYAVRYPDQVEAIVFDSGFTAIDPDLTGWFGADYPGTLIRIDELLCDRDASCDVDVAGTVRWLARTVRAHPVVATVTDQNGATERVVVDEAMLATILSIGQDGDILRPFALDEVATALREGDPEPLLRLASETDAYPGDQGTLEQFSAGANVAGLCADNDFGWKAGDGIAERRQQLDRMLAALPRGAFAPFSAQGWAGAFGGWAYQCLTWPTIDRREAVIPDGMSLPDVPTLILAGDVDTSAPLEGAEDLLASFPQATLVVVPGAGHNVLDPQWAGCTPQIVARFVDTLDPGDTSCATGG